MRRLNTISCAILAAAGTAVAILATGHPAGPARINPELASSQVVYHTCAAPTSPDEMKCFVIWNGATALNRAHAVGPAAFPAGDWTAQDIEHAYKLPAGVNPGVTVAVVDAYNTPGLQGYNSTYRKQFSLPSCTGACFRIVNQNGKASGLPRSGQGTGWDAETTLDVDMVSAACPKCKILVVEANTPNAKDLAASENTAARLGAAVISNSYGTPEARGVQALAPAWHQRGHMIVVSSGDSGYTTANFPADLPTVTSVGGTELAKASNARGWTERVWNVHGTVSGAAGSGCSSQVAKPPWQHDRTCHKRTIADVSAVAWNILVYDSYYGGWLSVGGTSAAAPIIAGVYALARNATKVAPSYMYARTKYLFDVTAGNNDFLKNTGGKACGNDYLCVAKPGYDGPTGLGTPNGTGAF
jgi:subtilase family serine protease